MLNLKPHRVIMSCLSPVVISGIAPSLDGILYEAVSQAIASNEPEVVLPRLQEILLFNDEMGVFHASSLRFGITPEQGIGATTSVRCDYLHDDKLSSAMFSPRIHRGQFTRVLLTGGPTKKRMTIRPAYSAPYLTFDFVGNAEAVEMLLNHAHVGVGYDYFSAANGEFNNVMIIPLDIDTSISSEGVALRPLPANTGLEGIRGISPLIPPYFIGAKSHVVYPTPVRTQLISSLLRG
ncbi:hypothetical protein [Klebsiella quasipneumoniae]|uniref:hypothetical protein n=1 Tax=Klebsiella quasipneumoniae TaxID=1463165 RepID=UPI002AB94D1B|nr:hypothetical protein [Klebsiella quasipneumoniae]MDZ0185193.1 hypothetical protein [Klebsiella quasipneumoniae]